MTSGDAYPLTPRDVSPGQRNDAMHLAAVYLWSKDPDQRRRAWRLLKLLLRRT